MKAFVVRALVLCISLLVMIQLWIFSSLVWWRTHPVESTMFMRLDYLSDFKPVQHQWVDYDQISVHFKRAVIEAEDGQFLKHHGFDWDGIELARKRNQDSERVVAGGSTISQQLSKNLFFYNKRSYFRKGQEAIATVMMERMWSKRRILEVYMNSVELGDHLYGVEAASQFYFGRSARNLNREQSAFLTALLANPKYFQNHREDRRVLNKKRRVMRYMDYSQIP